MIISWMVSWMGRILYNILITTILDDKIMNNAASYNNIYLCWKREVRSGIIKNFESSLERPKCMFYCDTKR
uniref:Uncharacterized protein n=1 Tax=Arundo donax TaxID=35708 RepID=A0A0A8YLE4_ARUDO